MKIKLDRNQKKLRARIIEIIHKKHKSHIGSCLNSIDIIDAIYKIKKPSEKFILSNGHSAGALYVVLEKYGYLKNPDLDELTIHPMRNKKIGIELSTGSLGQGLPIAVGMALANRGKNVYCMISDGESAEGSIWEALRIINELKILNLKIIVSVNGWGAYGKISYSALRNRFKGFGFTIDEIDGHNPKTIINKLKRKDKRVTVIFAKTMSDQLPFLHNLDAHYYTMTESDYQFAINYYK